MIVNVNNKSKNVLSVFATNWNMEACLVGYVSLSIVKPFKLYHSKIIKFLKLLNTSLFPKREQEATYSKVLLMQR